MEEIRTVTVNGVTKPYLPSGEDKITELKTPCILQSYYDTHKVKVLAPYMGYFILSKEDDFETPSHYWGLEEIASKYVHFKEERKAVKTGVQQDPYATSGKFKGD